MIASVSYIVSVPYVLALLFGGFESVGELLEMVVDGGVDGGWLALPSPLAAAGIAIGVIRHAADGQSRPVPPAPRLGR